MLCFLPLPSLKRKAQAMLQDERQARIIALLNDDGRVETSDLAALFGVTEVCIRKDLKQLAERGICKRIYGGATSVENTMELNVVDRIDSFVPEKRIIAKKALRLIEPEMTVFLDISTTSLILADFIAQAHINCTVVSTMIGVLNRLAKSAETTSLCPGGTLRPSLDGFVGGSCVKALDNYRFDLAFMGCYGLDAQTREITTHAAEDGIVKEAVVARSRKNMLVAESRKLKNFGSYRYASFGDFDALICDGEDVDAITRVRRAGLTVL